MLIALLTGRRANDHNKIIISFLPNSEDEDDDETEFQNETVKLDQWQILGIEHIRGYKNAGASFKRMQYYLWLIDTSKGTQQKNKDLNV